MDSWIHWKIRTNFLDHLKGSHRFSLIAAETVVSNECMLLNSTEMGYFVTDFGKHFSKTGKCKVEFCRDAERVIYDLCSSWFIDPFLGGIKK